MEHSSCFSSRLSGRAGIEEVGGGAQLLGHEADVFVGLVVAGRDAGISHQGEDISDGAAGLGIFLQPGHQLADQVAPAYPQAAGADLPQLVHGPLGEQLIGGVVVPAVLHQHAPLEGGGQPQPVQQDSALFPRFVDGDMHHAQLPGLPQHPAHQGTGHPQFPGNVDLLPVLQIVAPGHMGQTEELFLAGRQAAHLPFYTAAVT